MTQKACVAIHTRFCYYMGKLKCRTEVANQYLTIDRLCLVRSHKQDNACNLLCRA